MIQWIETECLVSILQKYVKNRGKILVKQGKMDLESVAFYSPMYVLPKTGTYICPTTYRLHILIITIIMGRQNTCNMHTYYVPSTYILIVFSVFQIRQPNQMYSCNITYSFECGKHIVCKSSNDRTTREQYQRFILWKIIKE